MRVRLGYAPDRPVQILNTGGGPILVLCKDMRITDDLVRQLDGLLRSYEPGTLHSPRMFRYAAAAEALGVSLQWLKVRVARGEIPYHKVGTYVRFTSEDVDAIRDMMQRGGSE